jgi:heptaprenyl diphosphate synthase
MSASRRLATIGMLVGVSLVLHVAEGLLPSPLPFVRLGLANVVTLFALLTMGVRGAVAVVVLRVAIASVFGGTLMGPAFALSMGGGLAAALGMGAAARLASPPLGVVGVSMIGAACHNLAQLGVVAWLYSGVGAALGLLPLALIVSAGAGLATGLAARFALDRLGGHVGTWRGAFA